MEDKKGKSAKTIQKHKSDNNDKSAKSPKTAIRASKYTIVGIVLTLFNFCIYTLLIRTIFNNNNDLLWLVSLISTTITTFLAYFLHSKITWKERNPGKTGIIKFFIWNILIAVAITPFLTWLFGFITPVYQLAYNIFFAAHIPFDYDFVESTGVFCFTTLCTMILNYLFYDRIVFNSKKSRFPQTTSPML